MVTGGIGTAIVLDELLRMCENACSRAGENSVCTIKVLLSSLYVVFKRRNRVRRRDVLAWEKKKTFLVTGHRTWGRESTDFKSKAWRVLMANGAQNVSCDSRTFRIV